VENKQPIISVHHSFHKNFNVKNCGQWTKLKHALKKDIEMKNLLLCGAGSAGANSILIMIRDIPEIQKIVIIDSIPSKIEI
jgi:hypothetical protein